MALIRLGRKPTMDLATWLRTLGLERYEATFRENEVDFALLPKLTPDDLTALGVTMVGHRRKLLDAIETLREGRLPIGERADAAELPQSRPPSIPRPLNRNVVSYPFSSATLSARRLWLRSSTRRTYGTSSRSTNGNVPA
jgi:hypothetical protein